MGLQHLWWEGSIHQKVLGTPKDREEGSQPMRGG